MAELLDQLCELTILVSRGPGITVLIKKRKGPRLSPGDGKSAIAEDSFSVDDMTEDLTDVPLVFGITKSRPLCGYGAQGLAKRVLLAFQAGQDIILRDQRNVALEIGKVFRRSWSHEVILPRCGGIGPDRAPKIQSDVIVLRFSR